MRARRGQALVEFSMIITVFMLVLLGMIDLGFAFSHDLTISYATREAARVGAALGNGGGQAGCGTGQSPNAAAVDPQIIAAFERVIAAPGSPITYAQINQLEIYQAGSDGDPNGDAINAWRYDPGNGPVVDGKKLDFSQISVGYPACSRRSVLPADAIGVRIGYTYQFVTPLRYVAGFFSGTVGESGVPITDQTVMVINPTN